MLPHVNKITTWIFSKDRVPKKHMGTLHPYLAKDLDTSSIFGYRVEHNLWCRFDVIPYNWVFCFSSEVPKEYQAQLLLLI